MTQLFPYQQTGVEFLAARDRALLADGMGLGKTAQAIVAANMVGAKTVVVVCPAIARTNWRREWDRWGTGQDLHVYSYDAIVRRASAKDELKALAPDVLILDEAHYLKSRTSKRTKAFYGPFLRGDGLAACAKRVWLLTGTPCPNDVTELYPHLRGLWPELLPGDGKFQTYLDRYVLWDATPFGMKILGNKKAALPELRAVLSSVMLRRRAEEVLKDLPPIMWQEVTLDPGRLDPALAAIEASPEIKALRAVLEDPNATLEDADQIALATLRKITGQRKAELVVDLVREELRENAYQKVLIFAHHVDVIERMRAALDEFGAVMILGRSPQTQRDQAIDAFQNDPFCQVFIGQIQACATAVTLTATNQVVFAEMSWTPADNLQAAKRAHRIGQDRPVMVRTVSLAGSIDEAITRTLARKSRQINEVFEERKSA